MILLADDNGLSSTCPDGYLKSISSIFKCIFESLFLNNEMQLYYIILCNDKFKAIVLQVFPPINLINGVTQYKSEERPTPWCNS